VTTVTDGRGAHPHWRAIAVFCGSSPGADPRHAQAARDLGAQLASRGLALVYGGGSVGLMGVIADAVLDAGGEVHGVITDALQRREVDHQGITTLEVVDTMHERKARMADLSDAVVMLPGGFGTLDEFMEAVTWTQLGVHAKPCGILNVAGYFDHLLSFVHRAVADRFVSPEHASSLIVADDVSVLIDAMGQWAPADADKWLDREAR
jgi:uncharacterized protein (TIGR00730 family)